MKSTSPHSKWIIPVILAILLIGYLFYRATQRPISFTLTTGERIEVFYLKYANEHNIDDRTIPLKIRDLFPKAWRKSLSKIIPDDMSRIPYGSSRFLNPKINMLKAAFVKPDRSQLSQDMLWCLSDETGWHYIDLYERHEKLMSVNFVPRDRRNFNLEFYRPADSITSPQLLGKVQIPNPAYQENLQRGSPIPAVVTTKTAEISILGFYTGIALSDQPVKGRLRLPVESLTNPSPSLLQAIQGNVRQANPPETPWTALIFKPIFRDGKNLNALRNVKLKFSDSLNGFQDRTYGFLYKTTDTCCLVWQENLPVNNGDYTFELTLLEDPNDKAAWISTSPMSSNTSVSDSAQVMYLDKNKIEISLSPPGDQIQINSTKHDPSFYAIKAQRTDTSETLNLSPLNGTSSYYGPHSTYSTVTPPVTSGTVIISIAKAIEHKLIFKGVPVRPPGSSE